MIACAKFQRGKRQQMRLFQLGTLVSEARANVTQVLASVAHRKVTNGILRTNWEA